MARICEKGVNDVLGFICSEIWFGKYVHKDVCIRTTLTCIGKHNLTTYRLHELIHVGLPIID